MMNIKDSVALITGANRGLGKALVQELIKAGARKIYVLTRDSSKLSIDSGKTEIVPLQYDVSHLASLQKIALQASDVNLLINNAGVLSTGDILDVSIDSIKHNFDTNFYGALALARVLVPVIKANAGGSIVNILTLLSLASMPAFSAYNASKAAAWSMTLSLRASLTETNIDVHSVFPGAVNTDMLDGIDIPKTSPVEVAQAIVKGINEGKEDIFPDSMSKDVYDLWSKNHKIIEKQFAQM
jgi:NAD(P)-dependent dehydrogenase (short-subunit alcohol dehydrogenase family)